MVKEINARHRRPLIMHLLAADASMFHFVTTPSGHRRIMLHRRRVGLRARAQNRHYVDYRERRGRH